MARKARKDTFTGIDIEYLDDGRIRMKYGYDRGWETFETFDDMVSSVLPWVADMMVESSKRLSDLARLQNLLLGVITK